METADAFGLITIPCKYSVDETVGKLTATLAANGVKLFATIDHSGEAAAIGEHMPPTKVLIFGNPKAGTPLMLARPSVAIDLPMKLLVAQAVDGAVTLSYNSPEYLRDRHKLPEMLMANLATIDTLARKVAE